MKRSKGLHKVSRTVNTNTVGTYLKKKSLKVLRMRGGPSAGGGSDGDDDGDPKGEVVLVVMIIADKDSAPASTFLQRLRTTTMTTSSRLGVCQSTD